MPYAANTPDVAASSLGVASAAPAIPRNDALVPAAYYSWQFRPDMWLGMSVNSPFGLSVRFPDAWAGRDYAAGSSNLKTYNATPSFAYRINDWISVGAGVQIQYAKADSRLLRHRLGASARWPESAQRRTAGASASPPASR